MQIKKIMTVMYKIIVVVATLRLFCSCCWLELIGSGSLKVAHAHFFSLKELVLCSLRRRGKIARHVQPNVCRGNDCHSSLIGVVQKSYKFAFCTWTDYPGSSIVIVLLECIENCILYRSRWLTVRTRSVVYIVKMGRKWPKNPKRSQQTAGMPAGQGKYISWRVVPYSENVPTI